MGIFGKIKFWKKEMPEEDETPSYLKPIGAEHEPRPIGGFPYFEQQSPAAFQPSPPAMFNPSIQPAMPAASNLDKELQIISAKLDTLKATLDDINHRLARLEKLAGQETEEIRWR